MAALCAPDSKTAWRAQAATHREPWACACMRTCGILRPNQHKGAVAFHRLVTINGTQRAPLDRTAAPPGRRH